MRVTEAMDPGFVDEYFRTKEVERDQTEEAQDEKINGAGKIAEVYDDNADNYNGHEWSGLRDF